MNEQFKGENIYSLSLNSHVIEKVSNGVVMMQPTMKTFMSYTVILFKIHSVQNNNSYRALKRILAFRNGETIDQNLWHLLPHIFFVQLWPRKSEKRGFLTGCIHVHLQECT